MYNDHEYTNLEEELEMSGLYEGGYDFEEGFGDFEEESFESGADPFLGGLVSSVTRGPLGGMLKGLAQKAAVHAGQAIGGPQGAQIAKMIANRVIQEAEYESELEASTDFEGDLEAIGGDMRVLEEMAHLANLAAESETAAQADHFIGAIASLAGNLLPQLLKESNGLYEEEYEEERDEFLPALLPIAKMVLPHAMPLISQGIQSIGRALTGSRRTREAAAALPPIAAKAVTSLAKQAQAGKKIDKKRVAATVAKAAAKTLASKPAVANAIRASKTVASQNQESGFGYSPSYSGYGGMMPRQGQGTRQKRIIRPRYCVY